VEVLVLDDGHCLRDQVLSFCSRARARELEFRATSLPTLAQMVAGGAGVTLLPEIAIPTEAERARLRVRRFATPAPSRTIALAWRPRSPLAPALRELARVLGKAWPARARSSRPDARREEPAGAAQPARELRGPAVPVPVSARARTGRGS
jgi:LysR family hydrogen peroxide-inducible transcriptional activator